MVKLFSPALTLHKIPLSKIFKKLSSLIKEHEPCRTLWTAERRIAWSAFFLHSVRAFQNYLLAHPIFYECRLWGCFEACYRINISLSKWSKLNLYFHLQLLCCSCKLQIVYLAFDAYKKNQWQCINGGVYVQHSPPKSMMSRLWYVGF